MTFNGENTLFHEISFMFLKLSIPSTFLELKSSKNKFKRMKIFDQFYIKPLPLKLADQ
jgi:hypothetical protein